jgi:hypothetical protein
LQNTYETLVSLLLPQGILEFFELTNISRLPAGLNIYLEEKNIIPSEYKDQKLEAKGFLPEISVQDFPIRGQKVESVAELFGKLNNQQLLLCYNYSGIKNGSGIYDCP